MRWDAGRGFHAPELSVWECATPGDALAAVARGLAHRRVAAPELNRESSRSHAIVTLHVDATPAAAGRGEGGGDGTGAGAGAGAGGGGAAAGLVSRFGKVSFVDLAGSERLRDSRSAGETLRESANINRSLFMLGKVCGLPGESGGKCSASRGAAGAGRGGSLRKRSRQLESKGAGGAADYFFC